MNDILKGETRENFNKLNNQVRDAQLNTNEANKKLEENQRENDKVMQGHWTFTFKQSIRTTTAMSESWENFGLNTGSKESGIVLTEELDKEIVRKLSIDQFNSLMKTLIENPVNFARITKPLLEKATKLDVIKAPNQEEIELAKEKYYEGRRQT